MKSNLIIFPLVGLGVALLGLSPRVAAADTTAPATTKVAVIDIQSALIQTKEGQKAAADLQSRFNPKKSELDRKQSDIAQAQETLRKGANTLSEDGKQKLMREIDSKTTSLKRETEDANADLEQAQQKVMQELGGKLMAVLNKYAKDNGYVLVLDVSNQQTPVLYASTTIDITREIIDLYDKTATQLSPTSQSAPPSASPRPAAATAPAPATARKPAVAK